MLTRYNFKARVDLSGGRQIVDTVQATSQVEARTMLESRYGRQAVHMVERC